VTMKAYTRPFSHYIYTVEMNKNIIIPQQIRDWLTTKDQPFDESHVAYASNNNYVIAFEYADDAYYFIAYMEHLEVDYL